MQDDPYFGYDDVSSPLGDSAPTMSSIASAGSVKRTGTASRLGSAARLGTAIGRGPLVGPPGTALGPPGTGLRSATGTRSAEVARPVSAVKGAGYVSVKGRASISASGVNPMRSKGPSEAEACKQLEIRVHSLIEEAALCIQEGAYNEGASCCLSAFDGLVASRSFDCANRSKAAARLCGFSIVACLLSAIK
jgi:hypothetical protein